MNQLQQHFTNEETGISYTLSGEGYYLPDLIMPDEPEYDIGVFGLMRKSYLRKHHRALYISLLASGKLNKHLYEIDQIAIERMELITKQMAKREGITEQLKASDMMLWVQKMNSIRNRVQEIINEELIYN